MADIFDNYIIWDGKNSLSYDIIVRKNPSFPRAARKYTQVSVPGRNGDLFFYQNAWANYTQTYELRVGDGDENSTAFAMAQVAQWLAVDELHIPTHTDFINLTVNGYHQLIDSYEPNVIRLAALTEGYSADNLKGFYGNVAVNFNCRPERFTGNAFTEIVLTDFTSTLHNPTSMPSKPSILIKANESGSIIVNGYEIGFTVWDSTGNTQVIIDSELQDCYFNSLINANNYITFTDGFPILAPGDNVIEFGEEVTGLIIVPRWWDL